MSVTWTEDQQKVIELRNRNILVSAAAGSGKTAVLVERIMSKICQEEHPVDIDRLLVVTFTKAAAAEMKERIGAAIRKKLELQPENGWLQKQEMLVHHAQITTIDSFCTYLLKNHFSEIDLDPSFRVADEGELKLLKQDVLKEMLESCYEAQEPEFLHFVECYAWGKQDKNLEDLILKLYEFSTSAPFPISWLQNLLTRDPGDWMGQLMEHIQGILSSVCDRYDRLIHICREWDGPVFYEEALLEDRRQVRQCLELETYEELSDYFRSFHFQALSRKKMPEGTSDEKKAYVKSQRDQQKAQINQLIRQYFYAPYEELLSLQKQAERCKKELVHLTLLFSRELQQKKRKRNIIDFSDMEHLALEILVKETEEGYEPTEIAKSYGAYFDEIMIDEYQDSNLVQEILLTSISKENLGQHNLFMVGDVKQSIYRFRQARPELFMEKLDCYTLDGGDCQKIILSKNFRSREQVLNSVNYLFYELMNKKIGNVAYNEEAALYPGTFMPEGREGEFQTELLLADYGEKEESKEAMPDKVEMEAHLVGKKILKLLEEGRVTDKTTGELRPVNLGDMVILCRSMGTWSETFSRVLGAYGISVVSGSSTGYFSAIEVQTVLNFLKILDNPKQDIPLCAVMTSPIGNFQERELAEIRKINLEIPFYQVCSLYETLGEDLKIQEKLHKFYGLVKELRRKAQYLSIHKLLWEIYDQTGYQKIVRLQPNGQVRYENLQMLIQKALDYEATSYRGLFHFVRYIENLQKYQVDYGIAEPDSGTEHAVHMMTIHKSKGLEFPIVFVCGLGKNFNKQDSRESIVIHPDLGIGTDDIDPKLRVKIPTLQKRAIQKFMEIENLGEELRVLYVALTRAREKLILATGAENAVKKFQELQELNENVHWSYDRILSAQNYMDWILPLCAKEDSPIQVQKISLEMLVMEEVQEKISDLKKYQALFKEPKEIPQDLWERFQYSYPYEKEILLPGKVTVSELKKQEITEETGAVLYPEEEITPYVPEFIKEQKTFQGADLGTAYHKVMESIDLSQAESLLQVKEQLEQMHGKGALRSEIYQMLSPGKIFRFCQTDIAERMKEAKAKGKLYQEQSFVIARPIKEVYPDHDSDQEILIQGMIDVFWEEEDGYVLLDYKTDRVNSEIQLKNLYKKQLMLYAQAVEQLTAKKVKECWIYSFTLEKEILL